MTDSNWCQLAEETSYQVRNFIDGRAMECSGNEIIKKCSNRNGQLLYRFSEGNVDDVNQAVSSAKQAFQDARWSGLSLHRRKEVINKLADLLEEETDTFALYESLDVGKPISNALYGDIPGAVARLRNAADGADKLLSQCGSDSGVFAYQQLKPLGVVGGILGWNFPLSLAAGKVGPALMMGNSLVLKPSEFTSLSCWRLAELAIKAGVPAGVLNVVNGAGRTVGESLASHNDVDLLTFVGSSATGKQLMISAGQSNMKRLILECGGKSPYLVFDDCPDDLNALAENIVAVAFPNQGALCVAGTRLLMQENIKKQLLPLILEKVNKITPQDPLNPESAFGAIINEAHMNKILRYIDNGLQEGSELLCGGKRVNAESGGYYLEPTIFDHVAAQQTIAQEEIFGPVLSIFSFRTEEEALSLANNSRYGLAAYLATKSLGRAQRLAQQLRVGSLSIIGTNTMGSGSVELGVEGHRESGFGMKGSLEGLKAYTVNTTVNQYF